MQILKLWRKLSASKFHSSGHHSRTQFKHWKALGIGSGLIILVTGLGTLANHFRENHIWQEVQAFSLDDLPSADYTTFPYRSEMLQIPSRVVQFESLKKLMNEDSNHEAHFDLCIVGDGLIGAAMSYEASLRGYSVCLLSPHDFVSYQDEFTLSSNMLFHHVLDGDSNGGLTPNFFETKAMLCELDGDENSTLSCKFYENIYSSMKEKLEKRNDLYFIAPHLMRQFRTTEVFTNSQKLNYYRQMWKLLGYEYFVYGRDLWMENLFLGDRNMCEAKLGILRNRYQERAKDMDDLFREYKDVRNVFRCITYYDSGVLNFPRLISSLALTTAAIGNFALNHTSVEKLDLENSQLIFRDKLKQDNAEYRVRYKHLVLCENTPHDDKLLSKKTLQEEYSFTLPTISPHNIVTPYGKFIPHYRYSILSLPGEHVDRLKGILKLGNFTTQDIYSSSRFFFDNELKLVKLASTNGTIFNNALKVLDRTKDYYASLTVLRYLFGKDFTSKKTDLSRNSQQDENVANQAAQEQPIYGSENFVHFLTQTMKAQYHHLHDDVIRYLKFNYGDRCLNVLREGAREVASPEETTTTFYLQNQIWEDLPFLECEIGYLVRVENCCTALDVAIRCQMYRYDPLRVVLECDKLLAIMKDKLSWDEKRYKEEKTQLVQFLSKYTQHIVI
ncbi:hypothetical protein C9374_014428 [Naegleria lovaniensis]|uniref:glycerol-3-phosphate dehydrogenase n=1 Tax=Naegleria lovaniensis TaxID=51637 RepID=A0AA88GZ31_NAELO|nr:uncharacterized protein C9374_014428 [Naegleria lovaniensis]KAG2389028.1 hypothetical protein C9374_014428 [Naegleria lovaniensis]